MNFFFLAKLRDEFPGADEPPVAEEKKDEAIDLLALPQVVEVADTLAVEVTRYRATPECGEKDHPLEWWSRHAEGFPHVAKFARRYVLSFASQQRSKRESLFAIESHSIFKEGELAPREG